MPLSTLREVTYKNQNHVVFGRVEPGTPQTLHRVADGQLAAAVIDGDGSEAAVKAAITERAETVTVTAGDPELRPRTPLLPAVPGNAMLSGFLGTHIKKKAAQGPEGFAPPKWYFRGFGEWLKVAGEPVNVPAKPIALIEEPEVVLVYVNDAEGTPHYAGYTFGNDLSDIGLHRADPLYNAYCKLCDTALVPLLFLGDPPRSVNGTTTIIRDGVTAWSGNFACGADSLNLGVQEMMRHLFSFPALRRPGLVNYVLLGADEASFHDGFRIQDGDRLAFDVKTHDISFENTVQFVSPPPLPVR